MADVPRGRVTITLGRAGQVFFSFSSQSLSPQARSWIVLLRSRLSNLILHCFEGVFCYCLLKMKSPVDFLVLRASYRIVCFLLDALVKSDIELTRKMISSVSPRLSVRRWVW